MMNPFEEHVLDGDRITLKQLMHVRSLFDQLDRMTGRIHRLAKNANLVIEYDHKTLPAILNSYGQPVQLAVSGNINQHIEVGWIMNSKLDLRPVSILNSKIVDQWTRTFGTSFTRFDCIKLRLPDETSLIDPSDIQKLRRELKAQSVVLRSITSIDYNLLMDDLKRIGDTLIAKHGIESVNNTDALPLLSLPQQLTCYIALAYKRKSNTNRSK